MRTKIYIAKLKKIAADTRKTLTAVIHDAFRESLSRSRGTKRPAVDLLLFHRTEVMTDVNMNDSAFLLDRIEGNNGSA